MNKILFLITLAIASKTFAQSKNQDAELLNMVKAFATTSAVTGREDEARTFLQSLFAAGALKKDKLGNLTLAIGSGSPKRLFTAPLDEPGYVVSQIQEDGFLRITPAGRGHTGTMYHQFYEGNEIKINTETGVQYGVSTVPSSHYDGLRAVPERSKNVFQWQESFIDVGLSSAKQVEAKGIQLLDPVTLNKRPIIIGEAISTSAAKEKASAIALATVAQTLMQSKFTGTVVIAWVGLELINGKGLENVIYRLGPFDEVVSFNRTQETVTKVKSTRATQLGSVPINYVGLPTKYRYTPVESVSAGDINQLIQSWLSSVENRSWPVSFLKVPGALTDNKQAYKSYQKENAILSDLIKLYGVSGSEKPVRDYILSALPKWAKPSTDEKGNIVLTFGKGKQHLAFVAHMDETGFVVDTIRNDGRLILKERGGFFNWVWEGHAAIIHTGEKDLPAVFEPRNNYLQAQKRANENKLTVYAGFSSKQDAINAGVIEGISTVTMPKKMIRLSEEKATARGFDDRVGCAALLMVLQNINPEQLPFTVSFVWSVEEEVGLMGSNYAAGNLKNVELVYPVDTYVSSDAPMESKGFGYCPLGSGAVIRVLESVNFTPREHLKYLQQLAAKNNIKVQYGMTAGGTDGQGFLTYNIPSMPLSWPGRYSHSPIEVMDFRDMNNLVLLIEAIVKDKNKKY
jgi:putative aminopeptidase FrvX